MRTLQSELVEKGLYKSSESVVKQKRSSAKAKYSERLTARDLAELMGVNRDTFRRGPGGAFRKR